MNRLCFCGIYESVAEHSSKLQPSINCMSQLQPLCSAALVAYLTAHGMQEEELQEVFRSKGPEQAYVCISGLVGDLPRVTEIQPWKPHLTP